MKPSEQRSLNETMRTLREIQPQIDLLVEEVTALRKVAAFARKLIDFDPTMAATYRESRSEREVRDELRSALGKAEKLTEAMLQKYPRR